MYDCCVAMMYWFTAAAEVKFGSVVFQVQAIATVWTGGFTKTTE